YRLTDLEESVAIKSFTSALRRATADISQPLVRAHAELLMAGLEQRTGDRRAAAACLGTLGIVDQWWVVGPFDNEGRKGFDTSYPPEEEKTFDASRSYPGKERTVGWRRIGPFVRQGVVALDALVRPDSNVVAYASAWIELTQPADLAVRVGSAGAIKVWVDGANVVARDVYRPLRLDQDAAGLHLGRGRHRLLVKIGVMSGGFSFLLRITHPDGSPLRFQVVAAPPPLWRPPAAPKPRAIVEL